MEEEVSASLLTYSCLLRNSSAFSVDGAIHSAAGPGLYDECVPLGGTETGTSKITGGHDLPARHVIVRSCLSRNRNMQPTLFLDSTPLDLSTLDRDRPSQSDS